MRAPLVQKPMEAKDLMFLLAEMEPGLENRARHARTVTARLDTGSSYAFYCEHGRLVGCIGVTVYWPRMAEAWLLFSHHGYDHLVDIAHAAPAILEGMRHEHNLRRIQADVVATNERAISFVKHFGFKAEGLMKKYDVLGQDNIRFARIWEDDDGESSR